MKCAICLERKYRKERDPYLFDAPKGPAPSDAVTIAGGTAICADHHEGLLEAADSRDEIISHMIGRTIRFEVGDDE